MCDKNCSTSDNDGYCQNVVNMLVAIMEMDMNYGKKN